LNKKHRHLFAALGLGAIAASLFIYVAWILVTGEAATRSQGGIKGRYETTSPPVTRIYTRKDNPGVYWMGVGVLGFFGLLCAGVAAFEYRSYQSFRDSQKGDNTSLDLLARVDHACRLYPEGRETLLRVRTAVVNLNDGTVNSALHLFLDKALRAHDREEALKWIQNLAKALDMIGKR
jgi:hypothetical protein